MGLFAVICSLRMAELDMDPGPIPPPWTSAIGSHQEARNINRIQLDYHTSENAVVRLSKTQFALSDSAD